MGRMEKEGEEVVYKQDDGEITAWLTNFKEEMVLGHEGEPKYKKIFLTLVLIGFLYLFYILV
ncbi:MAG: hypothetical protein AMJ45_03795 [Syntrophobacter sp. DG_60]|nr:MAG: hypothetical protein AMJ45_03795 [Syntrophobacter sp. DG_60]